MCQDRTYVTGTMQSARQSAHYVHISPSPWHAVRGAVWCDLSSKHKAEGRSSLAGNPHSPFSPPAVSSTVSTLVHLRGPVLCISTLACTVQCQNSAPRGTRSSIWTMTLLMSSRRDDTLTGSSASSASSQPGRSRTRCLPCDVIRSWLTNLLSCGTKSVVRAWTSGDVWCSERQGRRERVERGFG
jgi:hypothetical protein